MNADVHALAGAYAMDALPESEAAAFAAHLEQCPACRQEVAELRATAAQLGLAATSPPSTQLRDRVLQAVQQTRQVPPVAPPTDLTNRGRRTTPRLLAVAAVVVVVLGAAVLAVRPLLPDTGGASRQDQVMAVMEAPDARSFVAHLRGGGSMTVVSSPGLRDAVVLGERLPRLDRAHDYQLWMVDRAGSARSAHVLIDGTGAPSTGPELVHGLRRGDRIAITEEPAGGSPQPTSPPLAVTRGI